VDRSRSRFKSQFIEDLRDRTVEVIDHTRQNIRALESQNQPPLLLEDRPHGEIVKYQERPTDMPRWLAVTFSASSNAESSHDNELKHQPRSPGESQTRSRSIDLLPVRRPALLEGLLELNVRF
jgi:hypothetical protein